MTELKVRPEREADVKAMAAGKFSQIKHNNPATNPLPPGTQSNFCSTLIACSIPFSRSPLKPSVSS